MTQEDKQLLLKDLCSRLPYGVKFNFSGYDGCDYKMEIVSPVSINNSFPIEDCKHYLRLMSSMTEDEREEFDKVLKSCNDKVFACPGKERRYKFFDAEQEDFMNAHHFDYRGLIEKGLALEAPEGMYKTE